jgi:hypothetical protein
MSVQDMLMADSIWNSWAPVVATVLWEKGILWPVWFFCWLAGAFQANFMFGCAGGAPGYLPW